MKYIHSLFMIGVALWWVSPRLFGLAKYQTSTITFFFWPWVVILVLFSFNLIHLLLIPELEFTENTLKFHKSLNTWKKRVALPATDIESIIESTRKGTEFIRMIDMVTFIITTRDGNNYEYFPGVKPGKRLDKLRKYFSSCPGLPEIKTADEK